MAQAAASARAFRRMTCGGCPKARRKARRMRSRSAKPVCRATISIGWRLCSIISRAASTRRSDRQRRSEIALRIGQRALDAVGFGLQLQQRGKLRLAAGTPVVDHQLPSDGPGDVRAEILLDHGQREVDARSHPGRGPDRAVDDEDAVCLNLHLREASPQVARGVPVRRRAAAVEQPGFGEDERTGAGRGDPPASPRRLSHEFDQARRRRFGAAADDQRVEIRIVERLRRDAHADRAADGSAALGQQTQFIDRLAHLRIRKFENGGHGEAHHPKAGGDDETDTLHGTPRRMS